MATRSIIIYVAVMSLAIGCQKPSVTFPEQCVPDVAAKAGAFAAYDTDADGKCDYFLMTNSQGRIDRIGYDRTGASKPTEIINLDEVPFSQCRHLVLILDGFGYDVIKKFYDQGHLRYMNPPSRVIATYPTLTDLCMEDALGFIRCRAFEAKYFDQRRNCIAGGSLDYVKGANEPYNRLLDYRASLMWDGIGYLYPWFVFRRELNQSYRQFYDAKSPEFIAYYVSSAAIGTRQGEQGQLECLKRVDQLVNQAIWQTRGLTKVTILTDHGHSYTPSSRLPIEESLRAKGWRLTDCLRGDNDVVYVQFGLVTYASFATRNRAKLAEDLVTIKGIDLASYPEGQKVVVLDNQGGKAVIDHNGGRYRYDVVKGDPLKIADIMKTLKPDADGFYDTPSVLAATGTADYPDPLQRLWRAHFGLAENVPDVIVSIADGYYAGSSGFAGAVNVASTHGSLNRRNSTAFIMTSAGELPPLMRSMDIPQALEKVTGKRFPEKLGRRD